MYALSENILGSLDTEASEDKYVPPVNTDQTYVSFDFDIVAHEDKDAFTDTCSACVRLMLTLDDPRIVTSGWLTAPDKTVTVALAAPEEDRKLVATIVIAYVPAVSNLLGITAREVVLG